MTISIFCHGTTHCHLVQLYDTNDVFHKFKREDRQQLFNNRAQYKRARSVQALIPYQYSQAIIPYQPMDYNNMKIGQVLHIQLQPAPMNLLIPQQPSIPPPPPTLSSNFPQGSIMGGRDSQMNTRHIQGGCPI